MTLAADTERSAERSVLEELPVTLIGHPYAPIGMGEQLRSHVRACNAARLHHSVFDIFRYAKRNDPAHVPADRQLERDGHRRAASASSTSTATRSSASSRRSRRAAASSPTATTSSCRPGNCRVYPAEWARQLARFDEVWALSHFIAESLAAAGIAQPHRRPGDRVRAGPLPAAALVRHSRIRLCAAELSSIFPPTQAAKIRTPCWRCSSASAATIRSATCSSCSK